MGPNGGSVAMDSERRLISSYRESKPVFIKRDFSQTNERHFNKQPISEFRVEVIPFKPV